MLHHLVAIRERLPKVKQNVQRTHNFFIAYCIFRKSVGATISFDPPILNRQFIKVADTAASRQDEC